MAIVNQQFAQHYWPNQDPVGKRFRLADKDKAWVQIVGLAKTSKYIFIAEPPTEFVYFPYRQQGRQQQMVLMAESSGDAASLAAPLREIVRGLDPSMPIYNVRTMERLFQMRATSIFNVLITLVGGMGLMGLALAIVGLYGLVAYAVSRRTREIGIRMAIGADRAVVLRMILRQGLMLAVGRPGRRPRRQRRRGTGACAPRFRRATTSATSPRSSSSFPWSSGSRSSRHIFPPGARHA